MSCLNMCKGIETTYFTQIKASFWKKEDALAPFVFLFRL